MTHGFFSLDDPGGELLGAVSYVLLPIAVGTLLSRFGIYLSMRRHGAPPSHLFSPMVASLMMGILSYVLVVFAFLNSRGVPSVTSVVLRFVFTLVLTWPLLLMLGPVFGLYVSRTLRGQSLPPSYALYVLCVLSLVLEYYYVWNLFNGS